MIDDKEIDIAARAQALSKHINETAYFQLRSIEDFKDGARWAINEFLKNLWHPAEEEPRKDVSIMVETHNGKNMFYYAWNRWQDNFYPSWTDAVLCSRVSTRSNRVFVLTGYERNSIKKIV